MRYWALKIDNAPSTFPTVPGAFVSGSQFCTLVNGVNDPGALEVEFDIPINSDSTINGTVGAHIRIKGISLAQIAQVSDLNNRHISFYAGMSAGLPLANAQLPHLVNQGLLFQGTCKPAFANWQGNETSLELYCFTGTPGGGPSATDPGGTGNPYVVKNFSWNWLKNTPIDQAIKTTLSTVFKTYTINVNVSPNLKLPEDDKGFYSSHEEFSQYIKSLSRTILGQSVQNYTGIDMSFTGNTINVTDHTTPQQGTGVINYIDLIGQPTWIRPYNISFKTVVRSDLQVSKTYTLPPSTAVMNEETAYTQGVGANPLTFQGDVRILSIRHVGKSRQPTGDAWCSVFEAVLPSAGTSGSASATSTSSSTGGANITPPSSTASIVPSRLLTRAARSF